MSRIKNTKLELNVEQVKILKRVFSLYSDKSGILDLKELLGAMREAEFDLKFPFVYDLIAQINVSEYKNGIKFDQLLDEINKRLEDRESEESIERSFGFFVGNSGRQNINAGDIKKVADEVGLEMAENEIEEMIKSVNPKEPDCISFEEFFRVMAKMEI